MDEHELDSEEAHAGSVDELRAGGAQPVERRREIVGLEGDVVHPLTAPCEETADRRVLARRRHELDATSADEERRSLDALLDEWLAMLETSCEEGLVRRDRLVEVRDGDADVMDALHGRDAIRAR